MSNATWPCVMNRKDDAVAASDHSSHRTANGATLQPTPPELDPEALANLDAVCQAVKKQVLMWGPKAKWKIDLLLLPDALQDAGIADPTPSAFPGMLSAPAPPLLAGPGKSSGADGAHDAPYAHALFGGNEIRHQVHRFDRLVTSEPHKMLQLADAMERIKSLEIALAAQQAEMSERLAEAGVRAEKAVAHALAFTKHLQRQESELAARHEVERRLCQSEVQMLRKKLQDLTGARRFAAMAENGVGLEEDKDEVGSLETERGRKEYEECIAKAEQAFLRERRQLRKKLRASETRVSQREAELEQTRGQAVAYSNYAHQLQAHLIQQQYAHQQQHQHQLQQQRKAFLQAPPRGQPQPPLQQAPPVQQQHQYPEKRKQADLVPPATQPWVRAGASGECHRVRSGLDDLLAAAVEAEHADARPGGGHSSISVGHSIRRSGPPAAFGTSACGRRSLSPASGSLGEANEKERDSLEKFEGGLRKGRPREENRSTSPQDLLPAGGPVAAPPPLPRRSPITPSVLPLPPLPLAPLQPLPAAITLAATSAGLADGNRPLAGNNTPPQTPPPFDSHVHSRKRARSVKWTKDEDDRLRRAVRRHGPRNMALAARFVPGRSKQECQQRWDDVLKKRQRGRPLTVRSDADGSGTAGGDAIGIGTADGSCTGNGLCESDGDAETVSSSSSDEESNYERGVMRNGGSRTCSPSTTSSCCSSSSVTPSPPPPPPPPPPLSLPPPPPPPSVAAAPMSASPTLPIAGDALPPTPSDSGTRPP